MILETNIMILFRLLLYRNLELKRLEKNFGETEKKKTKDDHFTENFTSYIT